MEAVIINAFGCVETGAAIVASAIIAARPAGSSVFIIAPDNEFWRSQCCNTSVRWLLCGRRVRAVARCVIEVAVFVCRRREGWIYVNLSNYGCGMNQNDVLYFHNVNLLNRRVRGFGDGRPSAFTDMLLLAALSNAGRIIVQTPATARQVELWYSGVNGRVLRPGKLVVASPLIDGVVGSEHSDRPIRTLFYPASRFPHKRVDLAVEAVRAFNRTSPLRCVRLIVTVDGQSDEDVSFVGKLSYDELMFTYKRVDGLLFTSESESLGLPLIEALQHRLPAVLPDLPYARHVYGDAGVYFSNENAIEVADAIRRMLDTCSVQRARVGVRGRQYEALAISWRQHWNLFDVGSQEGAGVV
jgi:glycosyltransferase involved in cell wall biosynthesis